MKIDKIIDSLKDTITKLEGGVVEAKPVITQGDFVTKLTEIDRVYADLYRKTADIKMMFDSWEEIPNSLKPIYDSQVKALSELGKLKNTAYNAKMKISRMR